MGATNKIAEDERRNEESRQSAFTCLVVSYRQLALQQADQIMVMKNGRLEAIGKLDELLFTSKEMQHLWHGEIANGNK